MSYCPTTRPNRFPGKNSSIRTDGIAVECSAIGLRSTDGHRPPTLADPRGRLRRMDQPPSRRSHRIPPRGEPRPQATTRSQTTPADRRRSADDSRFAARPSGDGLSPKLHRSSLPTRSFVGTGKLIAQKWTHKRRSPWVDLGSCRSSPILVVRMARENPTMGIHANPRVRS